MEMRARAPASGASAGMLRPDPRRSLHVKFMNIFWSFGVISFRSDTEWFRILPDELDSSTPGAASRSFSERQELDMSSWFTLEKA